MFLLNNKVLQSGIPFTQNGIQYPANWLNLTTLEEKEAIGITEIEQENRPDDRFYWVQDNNDGTFTSSDKILDDREEVDENGDPMYVKVYDVATESMIDSTERLVTKGLKSQWIAQIKDTTNKLLASTDWMVIRKAERDVAIPDETVTYRAAVLTESNRLEAAIKSASTIKKFITVVTSQNWPVVA
tara:strand:+ start:94 stop:651 length:558 start_codon:yes stop_codon:yes gene_type:complete